MVKTTVLFGREQPPSGERHILVRHRRSTRDLTGVVHDITGSIFRGSGCYALECSRDEALRHARVLAEMEGISTSSRDEALRHARVLAEMEGISTIYVRDET